MLSLKRDHELFWILEVLLLTPVALFWSGVISMMVSPSSKLFDSVIGNPIDPARSVLITILCPSIAAWLAFKYISENKKGKDTAHKIAKYIIIVSLLSIALVIIYLYGQHAPRY